MYNMNIHTKFQIKEVKTFKQIFTSKNIQKRHMKLVDQIQNTETVQES